jgi:2-alkyl-3-oxoalkanoate reductase
VSRMRVAVIGAEDVIGRSIVRALASSDWATPQVLSNKPAKIRLQMQARLLQTHSLENVEWLQLDWAQSNALAGALAKADVVINATLGAPKLITRNAQALFAALQNSPRQQRVVHFSSMTVYGSISGRVTEAQPLSDDLGEYARSQIAAERLISQLPNAVILRPGCEYGPECIPWSERIAKWLVARRIGDLGAFGDGCCNLVYIDDVVAAATQAVKVDEARGMAFNLAMSAAPTWNEYLIQYARALGSTPVRRLTRRRLKLETKALAMPLKIVELIAKRAGLRESPLPIAIPPSFMHLCEQDIRIDAALAESKLGVQWTSLDVGLLKTADWVHSSKVV